MVMVDQEANHPGGESQTKSDKISGFKNWGNGSPSGEFPFSKSLRFNGHQEFQAAEALTIPTPPPEG
ncbi:MAG: hypothetical protein KatS3mg029_0021 [Saprospiraceae bacterium]|nr:MAG: hypothetical protein KatS3mg029_0021 [Saprospiraceae bacterium]